MVLWTKPMGSETHSSEQVVACRFFARLPLAAEHRERKTVMIDATYLKAHRTTTSMAAKKAGAIA